jgi:hypothetical protein
VSRQPPQLVCGVHRLVSGRVTGTCPHRGWPGSVNPATESGTPGRYRTTTKGFSLSFHPRGFLQFHARLPTPLAWKGAGRFSHGGPPGTAAALRTGNDFDPGSPRSSGQSALVGVREGLLGAENQRWDVGLRLHVQLSNERKRTESAAGKPTANRLSTRFDDDVKAADAPRSQQVTASYFGAYKTSRAVKPPAWAAGFMAVCTRMTTLFFSPGLSAAETSMSMGLGRS